MLVTPGNLEEGGNEQAVNSRGGDPDDKCEEEKAAVKARQG